MEFFLYLMLWLIVAVVFGFALISLYIGIVVLMNDLKDREDNDGRNANEG